MDSDVQQMIDECAVMLKNLMCINLEAWAIQSEVLGMICDRADSMALKAFHEGLQVRLMAALN